MLGTRSATQSRGIGWCETNATPLFISKSAESPTVTSPALSLKAILKHCTAAPSFPQRSTWDLRLRNVSGIISMARTRPPGPTHAAIAQLTTPILAPTSTTKSPSRTSRQRIDTIPKDAAADEFFRIDLQTMAPRQNPLGFVIWPAEKLLTESIGELARPPDEFRPRRARQKAAWHV